MKHIKQKFVEAAHQVFQLLAETIPARTFFIATTSNETFAILDKFNKVGGCTIPENFQDALDQSYCSMVARDETPLLIKDAMNSLLVKDKKVTHLFSIGSYLGVPIFKDNGSLFGTLCALDPMPHILEEKHTKILQGFSSLISNSIELERLMSELKEHEIQTENEFQLAQKIQKSLFASPLQQELIQVESIHLPSCHLSGDLFNWQKLDEGKYGVIILDVMGHDVSSALIGMMVFSQLKKHMVEFQTPYEVMNALNSDVIDFFSGTKDFGGFVTGVYVVIDLKQRTLTFMNAGHPPAIIIQNEQVNSLTSANMPLGIVEDFPDRSESIPLSDEGFKILLYTDGLLDLLTHDNKTVLTTLKEEIEQNKDSITQYVKKKISAIDKHPDDICVLSIQANNK
ncbi:GAF domain-containing SpoIIE family protein phosphatase [Bacillus pinisoli]|uniref:GAF domain-containing SpoIIE family protein phosphatase n=1 Tax=Bacillus pinisoli TaxID=2901866 RepID=UPI001FF5399E|nr:GAF domain-containing SpoIIE family protein phosphatase [Bacillus pinisoli]